MWVCRCRIPCGIVGFDCPSCDLCRPVPGCLSAHSVAPTRAVVWLFGHETVGQTLLFLHMHLFLHLHLLPCCQPLIDLSGLVLDVLAAGTLACWQGSPRLEAWVARFIQPLLHLPRSMGASLPTEPSNRCLPVCRLCHPRPSLKLVPQKTPNPSQIWMPLPHPPQASFALACQGSQMIFRKYRFGNASSLIGNCFQQAFFAESLLDLVE